MRKMSKFVVGEKPRRFVVGEKPNGDSAFCTAADSSSGRNPTEIPRSAPPPIRRRGETQRRFRVLHRRRFVVGEKPNGDSAKMNL